MTVKIDDKERFFNDCALKFDEKYYPIIKKWYFIFCCLNIINITIVISNIHQQYELMFFLPFFHIFATYIFWIVRLIACRPDGDIEYIKIYYPYIAKILCIDRVPRGRNSLGWFKFIRGGYIDFGIDSIMDNIRERRRQSFKLTVFPFLLCFIVWVISAIILIIKEL